jgi:hypothetical protein
MLLYFSVAECIYAIMLYLIFTKVRGVLILFALNMLLSDVDNHV